MTALFFLFSSLFYFLNLSTKLCFHIGFGQGWMTLFSKAAISRDIAFLWCHILHRVLLGKKLCHPRDLCMLCMWDFHCVHGNSGEKENRGGGTEEEIWRYCHCDPLLLEYSKILACMLACDLQSNNSWHAPKHRLSFFISVPLTPLKWCNVEAMPCRMSNDEKEAVVRTSAHLWLRASGPVWVWNLGVPSLPDAQLHVTYWLLH